MIVVLFRRLQYEVLTGIYECNKHCSCSSTCSNRLVQFRIRSRLQVFKTKNNGWGLRALDDIPQGAFICTYAGKLYTDQEGDERCGLKISNCLRITKYFHFQGESLR